MGPAVDRQKAKLCVWDMFPPAAEPESPQARRIREDREIPPAVPIPPTMKFMMSMTSMKKRKWDARG